MRERKDFFLSQNSQKIKQQYFKTSIMNNFFYKTALLMGLLLNSLFVFPQTKEKAIDEQNEVAKKHNLNGHYLSVGNINIFMTSGYYGLMGLGYEYRHSVFGANASLGLYDYGFGANVGCKFYLSNKKRFVRNLYFNVLPFCYFGQKEQWNYYYIESDNNNIIRVDERKRTPIFGAKILFGYSPTWHVSKIVSLGFNIDIGGNIVYDSSPWLIEGDMLLLPINLDLGFVVKFDGKLK